MTTDTLTIPALAPPKRRRPRKRERPLSAAMLLALEVLVQLGKFNGPEEYFSARVVRYRANFLRHIRGMGRCGVISERSLDGLLRRSLVDAPEIEKDGLKWYEPDYRINQTGRAAIDAHLGKARSA